MDFDHNRLVSQNAPTDEGSAHFQFVPHPGSSKLIVFFSDTGAPPRSFHFWKDGLELEAHRLYVNNGKNEWYQNGVPGLGSDLPTTILNIKLWARHLGAREIYTVGQGMGGHGAILLGSLLGARVLAFGAETTIRLPASRSERLLAPDARTPFLNIHRFIAQASQPIYALAGENDPQDLYCMSLAKGLPNYHQRSMNFVDQGPSGYLSSKGRLVPLLGTFLDNQPLPPMIEEGFGCEIEGFAEAYYALFVAHSLQEWARATEFGARAIGLNPSSDFAQYMTGNAYLQLKQPQMAVGPLSVARGLHPNHPDYQCALAVCMRELGRIDLSINLHRRLLRTHPAYAKSHHALSIIFMMNGAMKQAAKYAAEATRLDPKNVKYAEQAKRTAQRLENRRAEDIDKLPPEKRRIVKIYDGM